MSSIQTFFGHTRVWWQNPRVCVYKYKAKPWFNWWKWTFLTFLKLTVLTTQKRKITKVFSTVFFFFPFSQLLPLFNFCLKLSSLVNYLSMKSAFSTLKSQINLFTTDHECCYSVFLKLLMTIMYLFFYCAYLDLCTGSIKEYCINVIPKATHGACTFF